MSYEEELYDAILDGDISAAEEWISQGADIHEITPFEKWNYFHHALMSEDEKVSLVSLQFLLNQGLDVNAVDSYGYTPLIYAVRQQNLPAIKLLLENGAKKLINHRPEDGATPLKMVFGRKPYSAEIVKILLEAGADPDAKKEGGSSFRNSVAILADIPPEIPELLRK
ncbi:ankyrin repeat domain-containing protein [Vibrio campbellii]|uniref:ankyrin repeat domain-containing protein n=1 Tax=Vibrio campbellii TaxID=680 RepID=UPI00210C1D42|nr:ankyrin repeat domain-containing protein [Vibrio campbellii]UTZ44776.1 hypothetical protein HB764_26325 [Vibrio campbellii]